MLELHTRQVYTVDATAIKRARKNEKEHLRGDKVWSRPRSAISRAPDRGPGFDTGSGNILLFLLSLFQEGQLSVTGESMCTKPWLAA